MVKTLKMVYGQRDLLVFRNQICYTAKAKNIAGPVTNPLHIVLNMHSFYLYNDDV